MMRFSRATALAVVGAALALAACDAAGSSDSVDLASTDATAATVVADAVGIETAGLLDVLSPDVMLRGGPRGPGGHGHPGGHGPGHPPGQGGPPPTGGDCDVDSTYDATTVVTTVTVACSRSNPDSTVYGSSNRTMTYQYVGTGGPQAGPEGATSLNYALVSGTSVRVWPRGSNEVTASSASLVVSDFDQDTVTVNGTYSREGSMRFWRRDSSSVQTDYVLNLTLTDVRGTRRMTTERDWMHGLSGMITGTYTATITRTAADGTTTTEQVTRDISITLPGRGHGGHHGGGGRPLAGGATTHMRVGAQTFAFDLRTGGLLPD